MKANISVDPAEIKHFSQFSGSWWEESGEFRTLHALNPVRLGYLRERIIQHFGKDSGNLKPYEGLQVVDVGCGGGLVTEPMARLGAYVTGIDATAGNIAAATAHARQSGLEITYREMTAEALAAEGARFDVVLALEIVEHVADVPAFLAVCAQLIRPGGLLIMSTPNRSAKSFAMMIVAAEYILDWVPRGTHDWRKFLRPAELVRGLREQGLTIQETKGMMYHPLRRRWEMSDRDLEVNYFVTAVK